MMSYAPVCCAKLFGSEKEKYPVQKKLLNHDVRPGISFLEIWNISIHAKDCCYLNLKCR